MESNGDKRDRDSDTGESAKIIDEKVLKIDEVYADLMVFYDVYFTDGNVRSIFNPNTVDYIIEPVQQT